MAKCDKMLVDFLCYIYYFATDTGDKKQGYYSTFFMESCFGQCNWYLWWTHINTPTKKKVDEDVQVWVHMPQWFAGIYIKHWPLRNIILSKNSSPCLVSAAFISLLDNYESDTGKPEIVTPEEVAENHKFLDAIINTRTMKVRCSR